MAQIILKATEGNKTLTTGYSKYDVVEVLDDGVFAGRKVCLPDFLIVKVEGKTKKDMEYLKEVEYSPILDALGAKVLSRKRKFLFNYDTKLSAKTLEDIQKSETILAVAVSVSDIEEKR